MDESGPPGVWTTFFYVRAWNGSAWIGVDDSATFTGNVDADTHVVNDFAGVVYTRYIQILPTETNVGLSVQVMLRAGGGSVPLRAIAPSLFSIARRARQPHVGSAKAGTGPQPCSACEPWDEASSCPSAHQCYNFLETYDTVHDWSDFILFDGFDFNNPALDGQIGWSFPHDPDLDSPGDHWITLDTGSPPRAIVGVVTQGEGYDETYLGFDWPSIDDSFGWSEDADISKDAPGTHFVTLDT
eukprot:CAMPEP_0180261332 /NCGR_PEP_ID=MMETSP0987-20121128/44092_1 /TAXON_ID=697907 /ORGANISM="non described non described, Strain CCMP2293" /LENGTH=241 /DNA_ID=CAMNT_0022231289 /DNA_START=1 /DNA_END=725 /DNA_ORIENTATION=+